MDSSSSKFWNIELDGSSHTVNYGRTGTDGQTKTKEFDSDEEAKKSFDKLVKSKMKKGYTDAAPGGGAGGEDADGDGLPDSKLPAAAFHSATKSGSTYDHIKTFVGKKVQDYNAEKGPAKGGKTIYRFGSNWDNEEGFEAGFNHFLETDGPGEATGLVIGAWTTEMYDCPAGETITKLSENKDKFPNLVALFFGDIIQEESEISWIQQSDISPLLSAFPKLEMLRVRGGEGLSIKTAAHENLRALAIETGGLDVGVVRSVLNGNFPKLEHLELWLGTEEYGGSSSVPDLQPLFKGDLFPNLKYLGLRNCDYADDIAGVIVNSPLVKRIESLDLSLGTLSDTGAQALLSLPTDGSLKRLSLHHHFVGAEMVKKLKALPFTVDASGAQEDEDDWRFVSVGE